MINLDEFAKVKKRVEGLQREADQAEGALGEIKKHLKETFACDSIKAALALQEQLEEEEAELEKQYNAALAEFKKEWAGSPLFEDD